MLRLYKSRRSEIIVKTMMKEGQPIGTLLSKTCKPTFVHLPMGSRFTPRLTSACARSLRLVRRVFVRMVTGRGTSFASKNSIAYKSTLIRCKNIQSNKIIPRRLGTTETIFLPRNRCTRSSSQYPTKVGRYTQSEICNAHIGFQCR